MREDSWEAILVQCDYIEGPPRPPRIATNSHFLTLWPLHENWHRVAIFFTGCKYVCSVMRFYCPPYCRFKLKNFLSYCFPIWEVHWYGSEDTLEAIWAYCDHCRSSLGQGCMDKNVIAKQILFSHCDNLWQIGCQLFFLVVHMSPPRWGLHFLRLWYSWIWRTSSRTPKN